FLGRRHYSMLEPNQEKPVKPQFQVPEEAPLPESLSDRQKVILSMILFIAIAGIGYRVFLRGAIKLLTPGKLSALAAKDLSFRWYCSKTNVPFVLEVYDGDELVMRQLTNETSYTPDTDQKLDFEANHT